MAGGSTHQPGYYRKKFRELRRRYGNTCAIQLTPECTHSAPRWLEFAHVAPTSLRGRGRGQAARYHDIKRNPHAYILVCRACHLRADALAKVFVKEIKIQLTEEPPF